MYIYIVILFYISLSSSFLTAALIINNLYQAIVGSCNYYAIVVDPSILCAVSKLASHNAAPTELNLAHAIHLLQYLKYSPHSTINYFPSLMRLIAHSDASYLSELNARSRAAYFLTLGTMDPLFINGPISVGTSILDVVVSSAYEAEYGGLFLTGKLCAHIRSILEDLGYPQEPTVIYCDNQSAVGTANDTTKPKRSKAIDMRFHWIKDRVNQGQFHIVWQAGERNLADFFTKTHPISDFLSKRALYNFLPPLTSVGPSSNIYSVLDNFEDPNDASEVHECYTSGGVLLVSTGLSSQTLLSG